MIIAGNWKMNTSLEEGKILAQEIIKIDLPENVEVVIAPPCTHLDRLSQVLNESKIHLGAQDMSHALEGAFTGEISGRVLRELGASYVILGHSERRAAGETDEQIAKKVKSALNQGMTPILCVGESEEQREAGSMQDVIKRQIEMATEILTSDELDEMIIAYEPIWAIGTGKTATAEQAEEVAALIRSLLTERTENAAQIPILYGGSVKGSNAAEILSQPNINGALVGGASLKAEDFATIIEAGGNYA